MTPTGAELVKQVAEIIHGTRHDVSQSSYDIANRLIPIVTEAERSRSLAIAKEVMDDMHATYERFRDEKKPKLAQLHYFAYHHALVIWQMLQSPNMGYDEAAIRTNKQG